VYAVILYFSWRHIVISLKFAQFIQRPLFHSHIYQSISPEKLMVPTNLYLYR